MADQLGIDTIDREGRTVVIKFRPQAKVDPVHLVSLVRQRSDLTLVPPAALKLNLDGSGGPGLDTGGKAAAARSQGQRPASRKGASKYAGAVPSWWTARAREAEVTPGFSKAEILKPKHEDPRAPGGEFERVGRLLGELLDQG